MPRGQLEGAAVAARGDAARFLHQQYAGGGIPGVNLVGPMAIQPPARHVRQVERRRARATDRLAFRRDPQEGFQVRRFSCKLRRKADRQQRLANFDCGRRRHRLSIERRSAAGRRGKAFVMHGIVDHAR